MSDATDITTIPIAIVPPSSPSLGNLDQLGKLASDVDARFVAGKAARLQQFGGLDSRLQVVEAAAPVPGPVGPKGDVGPQGNAGIAIATGTVLVTFAATQALSLATGSQSLNFCWTR